ncbi:hypothetical protein HPB47_007526 [Ixodes persulcatus]|uniref:Uncharacterized protein n=1 Tax=Ixodes persulcatus TaxID=34615 RepID=A0AC60P7J9_IXOPE|nr:hypothetical protein HPB47_007526 [Ixodes persulcatus]
MNPRQAQCIPEGILDDLASRFIINIPEEERRDPIRLCFQIELAFWFYLDFHCPEDPALRPCTMREFTQMVFQHVPSLRDHLPNTDSIIERWKEYKMAVPTYGAIVLDESLEYVLLVQAYWARASWGFPKGKVNEGEEPQACAVREVLEETGFDISPFLNPTEYIERQVFDTQVRLYLVVGVPRDTSFSPRTRKEIKSVDWFAIADLPSHKRDQAPRATLGLNANAFFMVMPFVKPLRKWIFNSRQRRSQRQTAGVPHCITDAEKLKQKQQEYFASLYRSELLDALRLKGDGDAQQAPAATDLPRAEGLPGNVVPAFSAPSWTNFTLDKKALMACLCPKVPQC